MRQVVYFRHNADDFREETRAGVVISGHTTWLGLRLVAMPSVGRTVLRVRPCHSTVHIIKSTHASQKRAHSASRKRCQLQSIPCVRVPSCGALSYRHFLTRPHCGCAPCAGRRAGRRRRCRRPAPSQAPAPRTDTAGSGCTGKPARVLIDQRGLCLANRCNCLHRIDTTRQMQDLSGMVEQELRIGACLEIGV